MKNLAILIFACDRYELLFKGFDHLFKKNWDNTNSLKKYFATEKKEICLEGYTNLKSGYGQWTDRLKIVLDQIEEDYVIFLQEDMWFNKKVPTGIIEQIFSYADKNDLKLVKLHSSPVYKTKELDMDFSGYRLSEVIKNDSDFLMSHQVSIWNKKFLKAQLKSNEHPWRNERKGSARLKKVKDKIYQLDLISENGGMPINKNSPSIDPGAYHTISANARIHPKAKMFFSELSQFDPSYTDILVHQLENNLTHDGKPEPRKMDFFKKIKYKLRLQTKH